VPLSAAERQAKYRDRQRTEREKVAAELRQMIRALRLLLRAVQHPEELQPPLTLAEIKKELAKLR